MQNIEKNIKPRKTFETFRSVENSLLNAYIWGAMVADTLKNKNVLQKCLLNAYMWSAETLQHKNIFKKSLLDACIWGAVGAETVKQTNMSFRTFY